MLCVSLCVHACEWECVKMTPHRLHPIVNKTNGEIRKFSWKYKGLIRLKAVQSVHKYLQPSKLIYYIKKWMIMYDNSICNNAEYVSYFIKLRYWILKKCWDINSIRSDPTHFTHPNQQLALRVYPIGQACKSCYQNNKII